MIDLESKKNTIKLFNCYGFFPPSVRLDNCHTVNVTVIVDQSGDISCKLIDKIENDILSKKLNGL